jgi:hypothetical protein
MADRLDYVIANQAAVVGAMGHMDVPDTLAEEVALLATRT